MGWRSMSSSAEMTGCFVRLSAWQSCARACCGASLRRSCGTPPTALRCSPSWPIAELAAFAGALCARTTAMKMLTKRAARAAMQSVLLGAAEAHRILPEHSFARLSLACAANSENPASRKSVPGGGDLCGGEERRSGVGARSALRKHSHRGCPNVESEANAVSSAVRPQPEHRSAVDAKRDRRSVSPRRVLTSAKRALQRQGSPAPTPVPDIRTQPIHNGT